MMSENGVYHSLLRLADADGVYRKSLRAAAAYYGIPYKLMQQRVYQLRDQRRITLQGTDIAFNKSARP